MGALSDWLKRYLLQTGAVPAAAMTGLVSVVASLALTVPAMLTLTPGFGPMFWAGIAIAVVIPLLVAPPIAWTVIGLMQELATTRRTVEQLAVTDALTGVYNRRHFQALGVSEFERARRAGMPLALLMLDLDDFKRVNDLHGHLAGDALLRAVGCACLDSVRPYDVVARYGGEEFVVLLPSTNAEGALGLAERLRTTIAALPVALADGIRVSATASIGIAELDESVGSLDALFARADAAMYRAKHEGKNRVVSA